VEKAVRAGRNEIQAGRLTLSRSGRRAPQEVEETVKAMNEADLRALGHTQQRQFGSLGSPRVNVLELNLELDEIYALQ